MSNSIILDLHGMSENEAILKIETSLYQFERENISLTIITGRGTGTLQLVAENILNEHNLQYEIINNGGAIVVWHKKYSSSNNKEELENYFNYDEFVKNLKN